jgi:5-methylcytosine-specific restriction protein B
MQIKDLANELKRQYFSAPEKEKAVTVHLFGIKFADQIDGKSCKEIATLAGINESYGTEIRKGVNLAKYVKLR